MLTRWHATRRDRRTGLACAAYGFAFFAAATWLGLAPQPLRGPHAALAGVGAAALVLGATGGLSLGLFATVDDHLKTRLKLVDARWPFPLDAVPLRRVPFELYAVRGLGFALGIV